MTRTLLSLAIGLAFAASPSLAQAQHGGGHAAPATHSTHVDPLFYNNPTNQSGTMFNDPVLRYNEPTNAAGMFLNDPVLFYNNPLNQAGMYLNDPVLRYNNPLNQAGMYLNDPVLRYNEPTNAPGSYGNTSFNGAAAAINQPTGNRNANPVVPFGPARSGYANPYTNAFLGGSYNTFATNGFQQGTGNWGSNPVTFPGWFAVSGGYNPGFQNIFGWNSYGYANPIVPMNLPAGATASSLMPGPSYPSPTALAGNAGPLVGSTRGNSEASAILNGALPPSRTAPRSTSARNNTAKARRKSSARRN